MILGGRYPSRGINNMNGSWSKSTFGDISG